MKSKNHLMIAKGKAVEINHCIECGSENLAEMNFSANECLNCGATQNRKLHEEYYNLDAKKLRGLK